MRADVFSRFYDPKWADRRQEPGRPMHPRPRAPTSRSVDSTLFGKVQQHTRSWYIAYCVHESTGREAHRIDEESGPSTTYSVFSHHASRNEDWRSSKCKRSADLAVIIPTLRMASACSGSRRCNFLRRQNCEEFKAPSASRCFGVPVYWLTVT